MSYSDDVYVIEDSSTDSEERSLSSSFDPTTDSLAFFDPSKGMVAQPVSMRESAAPQLHIDCGTNTDESLVHLHVDSSSSSTPQSLYLRGNSLCYDHRDLVLSSDARKEWEKVLESRQLLREWSRQNAQRLHMFTDHGSMNSEDETAEAATDADGPDQTNAEQRSGTAFSSSNGRFSATSNTEENDSRSALNRCSNRQSTQWAVRPSTATTPPEWLGTLQETLDILQNIPRMTRETCTSTLPDAVERTTGHVESEDDDSSDYSTTKTMEGHSRTPTSDGVDEAPHAASEESDDGSHHVSATDDPLIQEKEFGEDGEHQAPPTTAAASVWKKTTMALSALPFKTAPLTSKRTRDETGMGVANPQSESLQEISTAKKGDQIDRVDLGDAKRLLAECNIVLAKERKASVTAIYEELLQLRQEVSVAFSREETALSTAMRAQEKLFQHVAALAEARGDAYQFELFLKTGGLDSKQNSKTAVSKIEKNVEQLRIVMRALRECRAQFDELRSKKDADPHQTEQRSLLHMQNLKESGVRTDEVALSASAQGHLAAGVIQAFEDRILQQNKQIVELETLVSRLRDDLRNTFPALQPVAGNGSPAQDAALSSGSISVAPSLTSSPLQNNALLAKEMQRAMNVRMEEAQQHLFRLFGWEVKFSASTTSQCDKRVVEALWDPFSGTELTLSQIEQEKQQEQPEQLDTDDLTVAPTETVAVRLARTTIALFEERKRRFEARRLIKLRMQEAEQRRLEAELRAQNETPGEPPRDPPLAPESNETLAPSENFPQENESSAQKSSPPAATVPQESNGDAQRSDGEGDPPLFAQDDNWDNECSERHTESQEAENGSTTVAEAGHAAVSLNSLEVPQEETESSSVPSDNQLLTQLPTITTSPKEESPREPAEHNENNEENSTANAENEAPLHGAAVVDPVAEEPRPAIDDNSTPTTPTEKDPSSPRTEQSSDAEKETEVKNDSMATNENDETDEHVHQKSEE